MMDFSSLYSKKHITPYMHLLECHLHEFVHMLGDVNSFNQQGHEKVNDMTTKDYYLS